MTRKRTLKIEIHADPTDASPYWLITVSGRPVYGTKRNLRHYEYALCYAEGFSGVPLLKQYRKTGKPVFEVKFDPIEARRSLLSKLDSGEPFRLSDPL